MSGPATIAKTSSHCYARAVGQQPKGWCRPSACVAFALIIAAGWGCSRTGLGAEDLAPYLDAALPGNVDAGNPPPDAPVTNCTPSPETCNGIDDDCNGKVDDGIPAVACPGGGQSYCVAGHMSKCPKRCDVCVPGSQRVCYLSYCRYWGVQTCTADGRSFGLCQEQEPPPECKSIADAEHGSRALEQCCVDNGYCCVDTYDLNHNGNEKELLGACDEVKCSL